MTKCPNGERPAHLRRRLVIRSFEHSNLIRHSSFEFRHPESLPEPPPRAAFPITPQGRPPERPPLRLSGLSTRLRQAEGLHPEADADGVEELAVAERLGGVIALIEEELVFDLDEDEGRGVHVELHARLRGRF